MTCIDSWVSDDKRFNSTLITRNDSARELPAIPKAIVVLKHLSINCSYFGLKRVHVKLHEKKPQNRREYSNKVFTRELNRSVPFHFTAHFSEPSTFRNGNKRF